MEDKKCYYYDMCQNGNNGCYCKQGDKCVKYLPLGGTNVTKISGWVETQPNINIDIFSQMFINWVESMGWRFCGGFDTYREDDVE